MPRATGPVGESQAVDIAFADHGSILRLRRRLFGDAPLFSARAGTVTWITDRGAAVAMIAARSPGGVARFGARRETGTEPLDLRRRSRRRSMRNTGGATRPQ